MRSAPSSIDQLESRTLLSGTISSGAATTPPIIIPPIIIVPTKTVGGPTLHETAGTPFKAALGFYASPVLDPPDGYSATINWGDGSSSKATLKYGENGKVFGIYIDGTHTYAKAGTYQTTTTLVIGPISPLSTLPTTIVERFVGKAIVAPFPANSSSGVTITEPVARHFTANLGSFVTIAPGNNLSATINWGDGTTSVGVLAAAGIVGLDEIKFEVSGSHTYTLAGKYPIHITVLRSTVGPTVTPIVVASIESAAIVTPAVTPVTPPTSIPMAV